MKPTDVVAILKIIRVHIVVGGALAFSLGALLAVARGGTFDPSRFALFYAIVFFGDLSTHYSNDYFDAEADRYTEKKKFFSGNTILVNNPRLCSLARSISIVLLILSNVLALLVVIFQAAPFELLIIALSANFLAWSYSAPPLRLVSRGLGEAAIALATGFAIPAVGYLSVRGQFDPLFVYFAFPFMLYGLMLSLSLEAPDIEVDRKVGKRNIGARKGKCAVFVLILTAASAATLMFLFYTWQITSLIDFRVVFAFSIVPLTAGLVGFVRVSQNKEVNRFSTLNIASLFFFNILMLAYLMALCYL